MSLTEANPLQFDLFTVMRRFLRERLEPTMDPANLDIQWPSNARTRLSPLGGGGAGTNRSADPSLITRDFASKLYWWIWDDGEGLPRW